MGSYTDEQRAVIVGGLAALIEAAKDADRGAGGIVADMRESAAFTRFLETARGQEAYRNHPLIQSIIQQGIAIDLPDRHFMRHIDAMIAALGDTDDARAFKAFCWDAAQAIAGAAGAGALGAGGRITMGEEAFLDIIKRKLGVD